jgi:hypothetical protein
MLLPQGIEKDFCFPVQSKRQYKWWCRHGVLKTFKNIKQPAGQRVRYMVRKMSYLLANLALNFYGKRKRLPAAARACKTAAAARFHLLVVGGHLDVRGVLGLCGNGVLCTAGQVISKAHVYVAGSTSAPAKSLPYFHTMHHAAISHGARLSP